MIVNNVSTHEGGGVALDDTPNVRIYNNTVMKNMTTATAVTSNGAAGAGRPVDRREQRPAAGDAAGRRARSSATRSCSTTSSGTTGPARAPAGRSSASAAAGDAEPDRQLGPRRRRRHRASCRPTNSIVQQNAVPIPTRRARRTRRPIRPSSTRTSPCHRVRSVADATRTSSARSGRRGPAAEAARRLPPGRDRLAGLQQGRIQQARPGLPAAAVDATRPRRPPTSTAIRGLPTVGSTSARTRSRRRWPTCRSRRPTA